MYYNCCYNSTIGKNLVRTKSSTRHYKIRVQRIIKKLKWLKIKQQIQEFQKFFMIFFIENSQSSVEDKKGLGKFFQAFIDLANKCFFM